MKTLSSADALTDFALGTGGFPLLRENADLSRMFERIQPEMTIHPSLMGRGCVTAWSRLICVRVREQDGMGALTWAGQTPRSVSVEMEVSSSAREEQDCRLMARKRKAIVFRNICSSCGKC